MANGCGYMVVVVGNVCYPCAICHFCFMANHFQQQLTFSIFPTLICVRYHFIVSVELSIDPMIRMRWQPFTIHFLFDRLNKNILLQFGITWTPFNNYNVFFRSRQFSKNPNYLHRNSSSFGTETHKYFKREFLMNESTNKTWLSKKVDSQQKWLSFFGLIVWKKKWERN